MNRNRNIYALSVQFGINQYLATSALCTMTSIVLAAYHDFFDTLVQIDVSQKESERICRSVKLVAKNQSVNDTYAVVVLRKSLEKGNASNCNG